MPKATLYMNGKNLGSATFATPKRASVHAFKREAFKALTKVCLAHGLTPGQEAFGPEQRVVIDPEYVRMSFVGDFGLVINRSISNLG